MTVQEDSDVIVCKDVNMHEGKFLNREKGEGVTKIKKRGLFTECSPMQM